jgi:hypothetical protein
MVVIYLIGIFWRLPTEGILALYGLSITATVWMVIRILKDPWSTNKTFDDYFYQDRPDIRRTKRE